MRLKEFTAPKDTVLTQVGINPNPAVDANIHNPDGKFSPLGTEQERPTPLTANHAVEVDKKVKARQKAKMTEAGVMPWLGDLGPQDGELADADKKRSKDTKDTKTVYKKPTSRFKKNSS